MTDMEDSYVVLLITTSTSEEAEQISRMLLERRKAACINTISGVDSLFWWNQKLDSAKENLLIVKSRASLIPEIIELVKELHSYDVPEIIALPIIGGNPDYLEWIDRNTT